MDHRIDNQTNLFDVIIFELVWSIHEYKLFFFVFSWLQAGQVSTVDLHSRLLPVGGGAGGGRGPGLHLQAAGC